MLCILCLVCVCVAGSVHVQCRGLQPRTSDECSAWIWQGTCGFWGGVLRLHPSWITGITPIPLLLILYVYMSGFLCTPITPTSFTFLHDHNRSNFGVKSYMTYFNGVHYLTDKNIVWVCSYLFIYLFLHEIVILVLTAFISQELLYFFLLKLYFISNSKAWFPAIFTED